MRANKLCASLSVLKGLDAGQVYPLDGSSFTLGRDHVCEIVLPLQTVSRQHARILVEPGGVYLEDLKSLNGTLVNGQRVCGRVPLNHGDRIEIHDLVLGFRSTAAGPAPDHEDSPPDDAAGECEGIRATTVVSAVDVLQDGDERLQVDSEIKLRAILEMIRNSGTSLDIDVILPKILESLFRIFPQATQGYVLLAESDGRLVPRATRHRDGETGSSLTLGPLDVQFAHRVMNENKAILGSTAPTEDRGEISQTIFDVQVRAVMCAPLVTPDAPLGVIQVDSDDARDRFSQQDLEVLASVATLAGQLVAYARWHESRRLEAAREREHAATERERGRLRAVLDILPVGVFISDADGKLTDANPEAGMVWGGTAPLSASCDHYADDYKAWWPETGQRVESHEFGLSRALSKGETTSAEELAILTRDGQPRTILSYARPIRDELERITGGVAVHVDITDRKQAEEALKDADRRKDEFLAMLAHELRNPLAPIRNALSLVQLEGLDEKTAGWAMNMIQRQVDHMVRLVDDLLDVSRATQGKIKLRTTRVDLAQVVAHAVETARPLIDLQHHELNVSLPPETVWLEGDEIRLAQIVANLLNNASKYTDYGGRIWLSAAREGEQLMLRVRDTGIGIAPDVLPRIFDLFTQADGSLDRAHGGLGIGLCLVQKLVALHGGDVQAYSDGPGKGSEFVVRLPVAAPPHPLPSASGNFGPTPSYRVLIVDDNVDAATTLAMMFRVWKHNVEVVHDGQSALEMADRYQPDIVLLDIGLPGKNGYEVAEELRRRPAFEQTLIAAITGYGQDEDRRQSDAAGFDQHLVKPVEIRFLRELLTHSKLSRETSGAK